MKAPEDSRVPEFTAVSAETVERWGFDTRLTGDLTRDLTPQRGHTIDHINCPSCQAYDRFVKSDLHGMAGQKFLDAARVRISAQVKSDKLRLRTRETGAENLRALNPKLAGKLAGATEVIVLQQVPAGDAAKGAL